MSTRGVAKERIIAMILVIIITISNFGIIGEEVIAYVAETVQTNNDNVEILAYFEDEEGNQLNELDSTIGETLILKIQVTVKNNNGLGGYFDGTLNIEGSNFNLIDDSEISVYVSAGDSKLIEKEIEYKYTDNVTTDYLSEESKITLTGIYTNSKKDYEIEGTTSIKVNWKTPDDTTAVLANKLLTNKDYTINEETKRLVQILVGSKLSDNTQLAETTEITITVPEYVQEVKVHRREVNTNENSEETTDLTYNYDSENHLLTINSESNGNQDMIVITYKLEEGSNIEDEIKLTSKITTYDGAERTSEIVATIEDENDGIVTVDISQDEDYIYKGKLYTGEDRTYNTTTKINIDSAETTSSIDVKEDETTYISIIEDENEEVQETEEDASITYVKTKINKNNFLNIFGETGYITIKDQYGNIIANITNESETNDDGDVEINYTENTVTAIEIITSEPQTEGILKINHEKKIAESNYSREEIENFVAIRESTQTREITKTSEIELKETESVASISLEESTIYTTEGEQELVIRATLDTSDESKDLYKNPLVEITLPEEITAVNVEQSKGLYKNGLSVKSCNITQNGNFVLSIEFEGEQETYDTNGGLEIYLKLSVEIDKTTPTHTDEIKMKYTNDNKNIEKTTSTEIKFESKYGLMVYNQIFDYNENGDDVELINDEETTIELDKDTESKELQIRTYLINNHDKEIEGVVYIGKIPSESDNNTFTATLNNVKTNNENVKIYYSTNINATENDESWTEDSTDAVAYKLVIEKMESQEIIKISTKFTIPENLGTNQEGEITENISYLYNEVEQTRNATINLMTEQEVILTASAETTEDGTLSMDYTATVGVDTLTDGSEVKAGEIITYEITVTNNGSEDLTDVVITGTVPSGTTLIEENTELVSEDDDMEYIDGDYYIEKEDTEVTQTSSIQSGATESLVYMVRANTDITSSTETSSTATITNGDETISKTITLNLNAGDIQVDIYPSYSTYYTYIPLDELEIGYSYWYIVKIKNISGEEKSNISVSIYNNELLTITGLFLSSDQSDGYTEYDATNSITIDSLADGETISLEVDVEVNSTTDDTKTSLFYITAETEDMTKYRSIAISEPVVGVEISATITSETSSASGDGYVSLGDTITYTIDVTNTGDKDAESLVIEDIFTDYLQIEDVTLNGESVEYEFYISSDSDEEEDSETEDSDDEENDEEVSYSIIEINTSLLVEESVSVCIIGYVSYYDEDEILTLTNSANIYNEILLCSTDEIVYYINSETEDEDEEEDYAEAEDYINEFGESEESNTEDDENTDTTDNSTNNDEDSSGSDSDDGAYSISGTVWNDSNEDGQRDSDEDGISGITIRIIDVSSGDVIETYATTESDGTYNISLDEGTYIVLFLYDTDNYSITTYQANGISDSVNSDAIAKSVSIDGETQKVAVTDNISLTSDETNIDLGLIENSEANLSIAKYVNKIVVTNSNGTTTYEQDDEETLAKIEIGSKVISGSNVTIEYIIEITNTGETARDLGTIVDYLPSELSFSTSLNSDWYQSGEYIYNNTLANEEIDAGETKEVSLILTKTMTESNTGLINNKTGLLSSDGETEISTASADVMIGIKTGAVIKYVLLTITLVITIFAIAYLTNIKIIKKKIKF